MSHNNFSSLFSKLRHTVHEDQTEGDDSKNTNNTLLVARKRPRRETAHETAVLIPASSTPPIDLQDLSIKLSFLCIGAQKAGTTWLHEILQSHPNLCLPVGKEVHFWDWHRRKGLGWYSRQFVPQSSSSSDCLLGEITPCYAILPPHYIQEIKLLFPDLKIIFIARNLVDRAWSAILMELRHESRGLKPGEFPTDKAPSQPSYNPMEDPSQYDNDYFMQRLEHSTHTSRSDYATALRLWLKYFPKEQIIILDYRDISKNPHRLIEMVCKHIGVSSSILLQKWNDEDLNKKVNAATSHYSMNPLLQQRFEEYLKPMERDFNNLLKELEYSWHLE